MDSKVGQGWGATLGAGGRGVISGLTLRRGDSASGSLGSGGPAKLLSIAVVGLSGGEKEKGSVGPGKSCLCNRFIQPLADDYSVDHISVFSQSDFSGRVVNNDHFLYWGDVLKSNDDGTEFLIQVVEHTEFIDDASFQPFRSSGKAEPYVKRCTSTKLLSAEKLMYICKDQLGIEREYEQKVMPDGRFAVDGFLCVYDVSAVPNRSPEKQTEFCSQILCNIAKTKKPVIVVATKCDEANEVLVRELERLMNRKELKNLNMPVVEASAHENVNVDAAFFALAQMIDRSRGKSRILSYYEAAMSRRQLLDEATETYVRLLRANITDYGVLWSTAAKKLSPFQEFQQYADLFGRDGAQRLFRRHVKKLKDEYLGAKVQRYFDILPEVLHQMLPDFDSLGEDDWYLVHQRIRDHPDFGHFFIEYPGDTTWMEANLFDGDTTGDNRIPFDILELPDAEIVFKNLVNQLHAHQQQLEMKKDFKQLLEDMGCVTPGKNLNEVKVLFLGRECYENLSEKDVHNIYDMHQREIIQRSKKNFQELLLERADLFSQFRSSPASTVTQDDILDITEKLLDDSRYKALDRLDEDRKLMLFQHLGFVHGPIREHCHAFPNCTDSLVERVVAKKVATTTPAHHQRPPSWSKSVDNNHLNLVVLGAAHLPSTLEAQVKKVCKNDTFSHQDEMFSLDYRTVSGDVSLPENAFRTQDFLPHGCFCVYSDSSSLEYIRDSLEKTLLSNLEQEDRLPFQGLPLVVVFASAPNLTEKELINLKEEGHNLAESLQCPFLDVSGDSEVSENPAVNNVDKHFNSSLVEEALRALIESIRHRSGLLKIYKSAPSTAEPDIRIIMCMLCGDPFSIENVLGPLLTHQTCYLTGDRSLALETQFCDSKRKVEVILSSYHNADDFRDELIHGFILVYSTRRRASLASLTAFSLNIPELPIQLLAVTDGEYSNSDIGTQLLTEGNTLADRLNAHFMTSSASIQQKSSFYTPFFKEVFEKKSEIEQAMEDAARLDDSGEGTLERPMRQPLPPPRLDSYRMMRGGGTGSRSGSGSENYERLPDSSSLGDDLDDRIHISSDDDDDDDSDIYTHLVNKNGQAVAESNNEHLVKPSQLKGRKKQQAGWVDDSVFTRRNPEQDDDVWSNGGSHPGGAFTTGRRSRPVVPPPVKPRSQVPGKLNMSDFHKVSAALTTMQITTKRPIPASEDVDQHGYAVPKDSVGQPLDVGDGSSLPRGNEYAQPVVVDQQQQQQQQQGKARHSKPRRRERREQRATKQGEVSDSDSQESSSDETSPKAGVAPPPPRGQGKKPRKKPQPPQVPRTVAIPGPRTVAIPVAMPKVPAMLPPPRQQPQPQPQQPLIEPEQPSEMSQQMSPRDESSWQQQNLSKEGEKQRKKLDKEIKQRAKEAERRKQKDEKRRLKEAEKEAKEVRKATKLKSSNSVQVQPTLEDFRASAQDPIPLFLRKAITYIEKEGLDAEGLYRVPGNRAHVDLLFQKFDEDHKVDIDELDIAVNAVATAVKDFFFKRLPPILEQDHMSELETISLIPDRSIKVLELSKLLKRLPKTNFAVLKYIFQHFVKVTESSKDNCMDSKNLAICWWPTLLQYEFGDLGKFEAMRPHLEDIVQTMMDQYRFLFCGQEEVMMV